MRGDCHPISHLSHPRFLKKADDLMTPPKSHPEANVYIPKKVQFLGIHGRKKTTLTASISTWGWAHGKHGEIESSPLALQNP